MGYVVVPRELEQELLPKLTERYSGDPEMHVIVDRRVASRRTTRSEPPDGQRRELRDRRRRRVVGEFAPLYGEAPPPGAA
jgi:hypothetical protein